MKKIFAILICAFMCVLFFTSCERLCKHQWDEGVEIEDGFGGYLIKYTCLVCKDVHSFPVEDNKSDEDSDADSEEFTVYRNQVTKTEFQQQYKQAFDNLQPNYKRDFVYIYTNVFKEVHESGEDIQNTIERIEYDADAEMILRHYQFQNNDQPIPVSENYFWEYLKDGESLLFYDSRTDESESLSFGYDEFWEFAKNQVPLVLFPNPNKLYDDSTYYVDYDKDGNKVFTLYSGDENGYSLRQVVFGDTEMIYRTKRYTKGEDYEDTSVDIYRVFNEEVVLTPRS